MYQQMMDYVESFFKETERFYPDKCAKYPFRNRFHHCIRVYKWSLRINSIENGDEAVVAVASIFHDIGKAVKDDSSHGEVGAKICAAYLDEISFPRDKKDRVIQAISYHQFKEANALPLTLEDKILMDADLLDEVGALTAVWDSMATALEDDPDYLKVFNRLSKYYIKLTSKRVNLKTDYGRKLYDERLFVIEQFIKNLGYELGI